MVSHGRDFQDRIIGLEYVPVDSLVPHPLNWRKHPQRQVDAFRKVLEAIGIVGAIVVYRDDVNYVIIDGHLRRDLFGGLVPVLVTDLSAEEAELLLSARDPLAALAGRDDDMLSTLCRDIRDGELGAELNGVLDDIFEIPELELPVREVDTSPTDVDHDQPESQDLVLHFRTHRIFLDAGSAGVLESSLADWLVSHGLADGWADELVGNITGTMSCEN